MTRVLVLLVLATAVFAATLEETLLDPAGVDNDLFGGAVATDGARVLAGARFVDTPNASDAGAAYVFDATGTTKLGAPSPAVGDQLGSAVAFLGADLLVGAPHVNSGAPHAGAVFLFAGAGGQLRRTFTKPAPAFDDLFGSAVAVLGGNRLLVGAPSDSTAADSAGAAYLQDAGSGATLRTFTSPNAHPADLFGQAVAATGNVAVVGAPFDDTAAPNAGAVYLFNATSGALLHTLTSPRPRAGDFFGSAVAASNGTVLVGAPYAGVAHLFDVASGALIRTFASAATDDRFGAAVGLAGGAVLVGAPFDDGDGIDTGIAFLFDAATGNVISTYHNPTPEVGDQFGSALAIAGNRVAISAWLDDASAPNAGAVYVFTEDVLPPAVTTTTVAIPTTTTTTTLDVPTTTTSTSTTDTLPPETTTTDTTASTNPTSTTVTTTTTATTETTTPGAGPTTTLAPSIACSTDAPVCDDHDPCTTDSCTESGCRHVDATGLDAVVCRLDAIDTVLHDVPVRALGGAKLTANLRTRVAVARRVIGKHRLRRARRLLARLQATLRTNLRRGRIVHGVGGNLLSLAADAAARLE